MLAEASGLDELNRWDKEKVKEPKARVSSGKRGAHGDMTVAAGTLTAPAESENRQWAGRPPGYSLPPSLSALLEMLPELIPTSVVFY